MTEIGLRVAETCFQAAYSLVLSKTMRDGHDERLRHESSKSFSKPIWDRLRANQHVPKVPLSVK